MGIVNRTPDSFYDGGRCVADEAARAHTVALVEAGADIVDIGAESSRPSAPPVSAAEQIARLGDLVEFACSLGVIVSVDTQSPEVASYALARGARWLNSVSLGPAAAFGALAAAHGARLVLTHCRGAMSAMAGFSTYDDGAYGDVVVDVAREWRAAAELALAAGLPAADLIFDPGLGFTKNARQSLELCARLDELLALGHPILVGTSRKSYIAQVVAAELGQAEPPPPARLGGSIAAALSCVARGASIVRVHDVAATRQALAYAAALDEARGRARSAPVAVAQRAARVGGDGA